METKMATTQETALLAEMQTRFEAYKEANDRRLKELEERGGADPLLDEQIARIDAALDQQSRRLQRLAVQAGRAPLSTKSAEDENAANASGLAVYMRTGVAPRSLEIKDLSGSATGADGGYLATDEIEAVMTRRLAAASPMRGIATVRPVTATHYKKPVGISDVGVGWANDSGSRSGTDNPNLDLLDFPTAELYAMPAASQALLDDAGVNLEEWLSAEVEAVFAEAETDAFVNGNGTAKPRGFLNYTQAAEASQGWGQIGYIATGVSGDFAASDPVDDLIELIYTPKAGYRANGRFVMNRRTIAAVRKFKDADGNYIWQPAVAAGTASTLLGYPVTEIEQMDDIRAGATPIAFGDFQRGYVIVDRTGISVLRDPFTAKPFFLFYVTRRVGGGVQGFDAIKLLKFSAS